MVEVRPDEVSAILRQQLAGFKSESELEEVGTVLQVGDGIARVYGLTKVQSGELVEFGTGLQGIVLNLEEDNVGVVLLGKSDDIKEGDTVKRTNRIASINVGEGMLGRVVNALGEPIDGKGPLTGERYEMPLEREGDFIAVGDTYTAIGSRPDEHDLSGLNGHRLRSHGGLSEQSVPFMVSRKLNDKYRTIATERRLRNFDIFDFVLNGVA